MARTDKVLLLSLLLVVAGCGGQPSGTGQSTEVSELTVTYYYLPG